MKAQDKTKMRRFKKHYPKEFARLHAITGSNVTAAAKFFCQMGIPLYGTIQEYKKVWAAKIPEWES